MDRSRISSAHDFREADDDLLTSGQPTEEQLASAARSGVRAVINLALHDDPRYSLNDEPGVVRSLGMDYVHIPVRFDAPTEADLLAFFQAMAAHEGERLLVHCAANKRVTVFLGLYRVIRQGWNTEAAFALMHSVWEPDEVWRAFIETMLARHPGERGSAGK